MVSVYEDLACAAGGEHHTAPNCTAHHAGQRAGTGGRVQPSVFSALPCDKVVGSSHGLGLHNLQLVFMNGVTASQGTIHRVWLVAGFILHSLSVFLCRDWNCQQRQSDVPSVW